MIETIKPKIRCLVSDVDHTLLNLRLSFSASILNADVLIPVLRFASLMMPVAIDTARDQALDNDLLASGAVSVNDLLKFMKGVGVHFSEASPDLIVMSESVAPLREQYMSQFPCGTEGWNTFVMEKKPDLHMIMARINEHGKSQADFVPLRPEDILILDDSSSVVQKAMEAGFRALLVPLDFTPKAVGTINVDYLYELADLIGLAEYAENLVKYPEACLNDPQEFVTVARDYLQAKKNRSEEGLVAPCFVHEELEQNLVELVATAPKMFYQILVKFKNKNYFSRLLDHLRTTGASELQRTMLGMTIIEDNCVFAPLLLQLGASFAKRWK